MKEVGVAELKARLSEYLRKVRRGQEVTVLDRDTPVARILPYSGTAADLEIRHPLPDAPRLQEIPLPRRLRGLNTDVVSLLHEERQGER